MVQSDWDELVSLHHQLEQVAMEVRAMWVRVGDRTELGPDEAALLNAMREAEVRARRRFHARLSAFSEDIVADVQARLFARRRRWIQPLA
ncbi:hypothetical protein J7E62_20835 [Variovorax paradoxus]|nr:hypothetical protein [Variovorax paradoxus]